MTRLTRRLSLTAAIFCLLGLMNLPIQAEECRTKVNHIITTANLNLPINNADLGLALCGASEGTPFLPGKAYEEEGRYYYRLGFSLQTNFPQCNEDIVVVLSGEGEPFVPNCLGRTGDVEARLPITAVIIRTDGQQSIFERTVWGWADHQNNGTLLQKIPLVQ